MEALDALVFNWQQGKLGGQQSFIDHEDKKLRVLRVFVVKAFRGEAFNAFCELN